MAGHSSTDNIVFTFVSFGVRTPIKEITHVMLLYGPRVHYVTVQWVCEGRGEFSCDDDRNDMLKCLGLKQGHYRCYIGIVLPCISRNQMWDICCPVVFKMRLFYGRSKKDPCNRFFTCSVILRVVNVLVCLYIYSYIDLFPYLLNQTLCQKMYWGAEEYHSSWRSTSLIWMVSLTLRPLYSCG
jgi:hypothetical protein